MRRFLFLSLPLALIAFSAEGHEFWIDPVETEVPVDGKVKADLRVGQNYKGAPYAFVPPQFRRFDWELAGRTEPVTGRLGDRPAVNMVPPGEGLMVLIHESADYLLVWDDFARFEDFVRHKDAAWVLEAHAARGLSRAEVHEVYSRYAKALVAVGGGAGEDVEAGLLTEIVALENPWTGETGDGVDVQVLYQGRPRAGAQVEVFERAADKSVAVFTVKADADGRATVPVKSGHRYMLDSVVLREPGPEVDPTMQAVWESLWANLTFAVPMR